MANAKKTSVTIKVGGRKKKPSRRPSSTRRKKPRVMATWKYVTIATLITLSVIAILYKPFIEPAFNRFRRCSEQKIYSTCIPDGYSVYGIDVSHHQGNINWSKLKQGKNGEPPITFVYIKATEGSSHSDKRFETNWKEAKRHGFIRGAYHYFSTESPGDKQARLFISRVKLEPGDLPPVVDVEDEPKNAAAYREELKKFVTALEQHYGVKPVIYTYKKFHERHINNAHFKDYPLWIARYNANDPGIDCKWIMWQCSEKGKLPGIREKVDINVLNGSMEELEKLRIK
jgi:lysozyme